MIFPVFLSLILDLAYFLAMACLLFYTVYGLSFVLDYPKGKQDNLVFSVIITVILLLILQLARLGDFRLPVLGAAIGLILLTKYFLRARNPDGSARIYSRATVLTYAGTAALAGAAASYLIALILIRVFFMFMF